MFSGFCFANVITTVRSQFSKQCEAVQSSASKAADTQGFDVYSAEDYVYAYVRHMHVEAFTSATSCRR
jgi:hypothetical protein